MTCNEYATCQMDTATENLIVHILGCFLSDAVEQEPWQDHLFEIHELLLWVNQMGMLS